MSALNRFGVGPREDLILPAGSGSPVAALAAAAGGVFQSPEERAAIRRRQELFIAHPSATDPDLQREMDEIGDIVNDRTRTQRKEALRETLSQRVRELENRNFTQEPPLTPAEVGELIAKKSFLEPRVASFRRYDAIRQRYNDFLRAYDEALAEMPRNPAQIAALRRVRDTVVPGLLRALDLENQIDPVQRYFREQNEGAAHMAVVAFGAGPPAAALDAAPVAAPAEQGLSAENIARFNAAAANARGGDFGAPGAESWSIFTGQPQDAPGPGLQAPRVAGGQEPEVRRQRGGRHRSSRSGRARTQKSRNRSAPKRRTLRAKRS